MRAFFAKAALGTKLKAINLLAVSLVAFFAMLSLGVVLYQRSIADQQRHLDSLTRVMGDNLTAALVFVDAKTAQSTLEGLAQADDIEQAGLYDATGKLFASYSGAGAHQGVAATLNLGQMPRDTGFVKTSIDATSVLRDVGDNTNQIGTLIVRQGLNNTYQQLWQQLAAVFAASLVAFALLNLLLNRLQRHITQPLTDLTATMRKIQQGADLSGRALVGTDDEIGELAKSFNYLMVELQLRDNEKNAARSRFEAVLKAVPDLMFELDREGRYINVWGARADFLMAPARELVGRQVQAQLPRPAANEVLVAMGEADESSNGHSFGRCIMLPLPQGERWFELSVAKYQARSDDDKTYVVLSRDITERRHAEEEIRQLAFYDVLTHLPNRRLLMERLHTALAISTRTQMLGAVLFLDMDRFKTINDTLGHDHGDLLLVEVAKRIQSCVREVDTIARVGGDEFVVVLEQLGTDADQAARNALQVAEKIRVSLAVPYQLNAHERYSSPSIGVCMYLGNGVASEDLIKNADVAMYQAKDDGRNLVRFFDLAMQNAVEARAQIDTDLRHSVQDQQLRLYYQIQVDQQHRPCGAEALVRWFHPQRGMVPPAVFIGIAEESHLILDIGNWVLDAACKQLSLWAGQAHTQALTIAVNVSAQQFKQPQFVDLVTDALARHAVEPTRLKIELTESVILNDVTTIISKMHALKALGVILSLDDFGTGYSSLSYLKRLPLDQIKIDQSFVRDVETDESDAVMIRSIIDLAANFKLNVIAEGVETLEQLNFLKRNGCAEFQGYYFSKPVPIDEFERLLTQPNLNLVPLNHEPLGTAPSPTMAAGSGFNVMPGMKGLAL